MNEDIIDIIIVEEPEDEIEISIDVNPDNVDTSDGNITPDKVFKAYIGYAKGQRIEGTFELNGDVIDTSNGDITPSDVVLGKKGYAKGQEVTGALDLPALEQTAYNDGYTDGGQSVIDSQGDATITPDKVLKDEIGYSGITRIVGVYEPYAPYWKPDPLWWNIKKIVEEYPLDATYKGAMICMYNDEWHSVENMRGADAYITPSGDVLTAVSLATQMSYTWKPSDLKIDSSGRPCKYIIRLYKNPTITVVNNNFGNIGSLGSFGGRPIYIVARELTMPFANLLTNGYSFQAYDHIDCIYTGVSAQSFIGGTTQQSLQYVPDYFPGIENVNRMDYMFSSPAIKKVSIQGMDFTNITNYSNVLYNMRALEEIDGVLDLNNGIAQGNLLIGCFNLKRFTIRNLKTDFNINSPIVDRDVMLDLVNNGMVDLGGQTRTFTSESLRVLTDAEKQPAINNGWILVS